MNIRFFRTIFLVQITCLLGFCVPVLSQGYGVNKIVIDAGHGGKDPGALGKQAKEKDVVLKVALLTGKYIEKNIPGVEVLYTRADDRYLTLRQRAEFANEAKADVFISIHANAAGSTAAYGAENFILGTNKSENNLKIAQKENSVITFEEDFEEKYEGFNPNSPESYIIFNFMQDAFQEQSMALASAIQHQYTTRVGRKDREVQQAGFWVLAATSMPAVLTELGFLSNPNEEKFLISQEGQEYMASAIYRAVKEYKRDIESKQSLTMTEVEANGYDEIPDNSSKTGVVYKLQIFSATEVLKKDDARVKGLENVAYYNDGKMYKYTMGASSNIKDVKKLQQNYKDAFKGCFIVAFSNGERISLSQARKLSQ